MLMLSTSSYPSPPACCGADLVVLLRNHRSQWQSKQAFATWLNGSGAAFPTPTIGHKCKEQDENCIAAPAFAPPLLPRHVRSELVRCFSVSIPNNSSQSQNAKPTTNTDAKEGKTHHEAAATEEVVVDESKLGFAARGKLMLKRYGSVFVGTYFSIYLVTLSSFYIGIDMGWLDPSHFLVGGETAAAEVMHDEEDSMTPSPAGMAKYVIELAHKYEWTRPYAPTIEGNPKLLNLGIAWIGTKMVEPIRLAVCLSIVPSVARHLGMAPPKPPKSTEKEKKEPSEIN
mmetsp:Transcript_26470/g.41029  ORF Transcript_26470/g.41029 Transcript_26470/m.41029 type:complete len:285 (-) Transcript_26470:208-1062(-)